MFNLPLIVVDQFLSVGTLTAFPSFPTNCIVDNIFKLSCQSL